MSLPILPCQFVSFRQVANLIGFWHGNWPNIRAYHLVYEDREPWRVDCSVGEEMDGNMNIGGSEQCCRSFFRSWMCMVYPIRIGPLSLLNLVIFWM